MFLRASTVWNDLRYGIQLFCSQGVFTYLLSLLEPYEDRGCGGLAHVDVKQTSVQGVDKEKNKWVNVINYQLLYVASGLSSRDFMGELETHERCPLMEQILSFMIDNSKKKKNH